MRRALCSLCSALILLGGAFAEDAAPAPRRARIAVAVEAPEGAEWEASLAAAISRSPRFAAVGRVPAGADPLEYAASRAFDLLAEASVSLSADGAEALLSYAVRSARTGESLAEAEGPHPVPEAFALSQTFWFPVVAAAEAAAERLGAPPALSPSAPRPGSRWSVESALYMGQFADFWFGRGFRSDRFFVKAGLFQFLTGAYYGDEGLESASYALIHPGLAFGAYFNRADAPFRPYAVVAAFYRLSGNDFAPDPIAPYGVAAMLGGEWRLRDRTAAFFEIGLAHYPWCDGYLLAVELANGRGNGGRGPYSFEYSDDSLTEYPQFRFGLRLNP
jgi:hypothetical protein